MIKIGMVVANLTDGGAEELCKAMAGEQAMLLLE
jgi:hypothetical protein